MEKTKRIQSNSRVLVLGIAMLSGLLLLLVRLGHVQLVNGHFFAEQAKDNRLFTLPLAQNRGIIYDRYQQPLVLNAPDYYLINDSEALFSDVVHVSRYQAMNEIISGEQLVSHSFQRHYLYPTVLSHAVGYIAPATSDEMVAGSLSSSDLVGRMGLERTTDRTLRGEAGSQIVEIDALGSKKRLVEQHPAQDGQSVMSTLDPVLSYVAQTIMGDKVGAVVIMDPETGKVLSLLSNPGFDLNLFSSIQHDKELEKNRRLIVQDLLTDEKKVLFNRAVSGAYPPGSVFKMITALAGLDADAFDERTTVKDEGVLNVGEYSYANWFYTSRGGVDGEIAVQRAIARSNDIFFYKAAEWTGPDTIADMARLFGFGKPTGIQVSSETSGLVPDPAWKEENLGERWFLGNTYHFGIGQGDTLVSPIQVAQMTQVISQHGTHCAPTLLDSELPNCQMIGVSEEDLDLVLNGMLDACSQGGTAGIFFDRNARYRSELSSPKTRLGESQPQKEIDSGAIACKTGTAEFGGRNEKGFRNTHAWFTAILGVNLDEWDEESASGSAQVEIAESETNSDWEHDLQRSKLQELIESENTEYEKLHAVWKEMVTEYGFPKRLVFTVLVESDEVEPLREGSVDSAPVVRDILNWIETGQLKIQGA